MMPIFNLLRGCSRSSAISAWRSSALTFIVRGLMFPIADKQFRSMAGMRKVQPKMKALQERYKDDKPRLQQEMLKLYQEEKINPAAGCLPILLQIPIFYALYKVLMVSVEMRHQPFALWIKDLSAPDPLTPVNLFGLLDFTPPGFLAIGVLPILLGVTMWMQFKLNPQQMDPVQQQIFSIMPWVLMFVMAPFAAGLQLYWVVSNILTIAQQAWLYKRYDMHLSDTHPVQDLSVVDDQPDIAERARKLFAGPIEFLKSAPKLEHLPEPTVPEIAFAGRSNVGKSSLINAVTNRNKLARASNTPGRTQELNYFDVGQPLVFRLVDMPGYGFAEAPRDMVKRWRFLINDYPPRPAGAEARAGAGRCAPRPQGRRPRRDDDARRCGGQLSPGPDQGRQDQADRTGQDHRGDPRRSRQASGRPSAHPADVQRNRRRASPS